MDCPTDPVYSVFFRQLVCRAIAAQFKGRTTPKKLDAITENLERLEQFGPAIPEHHDDLTTWHFADSSTKAA